MNFVSRILAQRKYIKRIFVKDKDVAIIANNCVGAAICGDFALQYNSPTMNLQISPLEYSKFCKNIEHYISLPLYNVETPSDYQKSLIKDIYGDNFELNFPLGMVGDVTIFFQHYVEFEKAKSDWDRRKSRVKIKAENCVFLFIETFTDKYTQALESFDSWDGVDKSRKLVIATNYKDVKVCNCLFTQVDTPKGVHVMEYKSLWAKYYQNGFNYLKWLNSIKN